jgi:hypothetical protein
MLDSHPCVGVVHSLYGRLIYDVTMFIGLAGHTICNNDSHNICQHQVG